MRVQSDFKDYYDAGMATGQDQTLVYRRYMEVEKFAHYQFPALSTHTIYYRGDPLPCIHANSCMIGFCGKVYPVLIVYPADLAHGKGREARDSRKLVYKLEELDTYIRNHYSEDIYDDYCSTKYRRKPLWPGYFRRGSFQKFFDDVEKVKEKYAKWFEDKRCPIFVSEYHKPQEYRWQTVDGKMMGDKDKPYRIHYNACLKDYEFYRVFDTIAAYQEIAMWLGNQAEPRKPIPDISDEVMAEIKGFDKFSFRKDKKQ